jgi:hypothetical protein
MKWHSYTLFKVSLPGDLFGTEDEAEARDTAIYQARETSLTFVSPCVWIASLIGGEMGVSNSVTFRVIRVSYLNRKRPA